MGVSPDISRDGGQAQRCHGSKPYIVTDKIHHKLEHQRTLAPGDAAHSVPIEALTQFISGGLLGMLIWGLGGKMRMSAEEMNAAFRRLAIPAVKAAVR
jgi:hypothetical protein